MGVGDGVVGGLGLVYVVVGDYWYDCGYVGYFGDVIVVLLLLVVFGVIVGVVVCKCVLVVIIGFGCVICDVGVGCF